MASSKVGILVPQSIFSILHGGVDSSDNTEDPPQADPPPDDFFKFSK
jgi:hypothetical protein